MTSDREFLDGIYKKAEKLMDEQDTSLNNRLETKIRLWNSYKKFAPVMAICLFILIAVPVYWAINPVNEKSLNESSVRSGNGVATPRKADLHNETIEEGNAAYTPIECEVFGEITAVVENGNTSYFLLKTIEIVEGFAPDTILVKCDNTIFKENKVSPAIGDKGKFTLEEQPFDVFKEEYNNRVMIESNRNSEELVDKAINASESGNGSIGYFNIKSIGEYYGI